MPYNTTPIAPPKDDYTGQVSLPLSKVKKIIAADEDINSCSNNAAFVITIATEMFVQYLVEQAHVVVKSEKKPRRNIQYKDIAKAVNRIDNLEFLSDVVPQTVPFKKFKEDKAKEAASAPVPNGQTSLSFVKENDDQSKEPLTTVQDSDEEDMGSIEEFAQPVHELQEMEVEIRGKKQEQLPNEPSTNGLSSSAV